jgi:signal transduction histidine kinase
LSIWRLVLQPMRLVNRSITEQKPELLDHIAKAKTEFGGLAQTVQLFYSQRMKIQESEFLKSKLVELNRAKSEFLAIAAHELKGPVGNVHIFTENLADLLKEGKSKDVLLTETERISQQARKATLLINDMYQASKGGQVLEVTRTEFAFDDFIKQEIENAQYSTQQKIVLEGSTDHHVTSDVNRLGQVMTNLIRNASKYSPPTSTITIHISYKNNLVTTEIEDAGMGIPEAEQSKIFTRFFRSSRVTQSYPGLGLGLSVCKEIIEALDGKIWLISEENRGSHFYFSIPVSPSEQEIS